jgi:hypothetical protein
MGTGTWAVQTVMDAVMTWNYDVEHPELRALYEKAKREQWNATTAAVDAKRGPGRHHSRR